MPEVSCSGFAAGSPTAGTSTEQLGLNDVANDVIEILRGDLLRRGVTLTRRLSPKLPAIAGDRVQLQQVVLNLILNACDAMRDNPPGDRHVLVMTAPMRRGCASLCRGHRNRDNPRSTQLGVRAVRDDEDDWPWIGAGALSFDRARARRPADGREQPCARGNLPLPPAACRRSKSGVEAGEPAHICDPLRPKLYRFTTVNVSYAVSLRNVFVVEHDEGARTALSRHLNSFGFAVRAFNSAESFLAQRPASGRGVPRAQRSAAWPVGVGASETSPKREHPLGSFRDGSR